MARASLHRFCTAVSFVLLLASGPAHALITLQSPSWSELTAEQRGVLAPLMRDWDAMEPDRRRKWIGIAQRYAGMAPAEKARVQDRMKEWARLTPVERKAARDGYSSLQLAPADRRESMKATISQQWQAYQNLPEAERARLRSEAAGETASERRSSVSATVPRSDPPSSPPPR